MGILDKLQSFIASGNQADPETGLTRWDKLGAVGASLQGFGDPQAGAAAMRPYQEKMAAARRSAQSKQQSDYLDELAQRIGLSPGERLLMRVSPDKAAEVLSKKLSPLVVGGQVYQEGEFKAPTEYKVDQGRGYSIGPDGLKEIGNLQPSYGEVTARQQIDRPIAVGDGSVLVDPRSGKQIYNNPKTFAPQRPAGGALSGMTTEQLISLAGSLK